MCKRKISNSVSPIRSASTTQDRILMRAEKIHKKQKKQNDQKRVSAGQVPPEITVRNTFELLRNHIFNSNALDIFRGRTVIGDCNDGNDYDRGPDSFLIDFQLLNLTHPILNDNVSKDCSKNYLHFIYFVHFLLLGTFSRIIEFYPSSLHFRT